MPGVGHSVDDCIMNVLLLDLQKRRKEREAKPKKVGQHYYPKANIKNRNRNKKAKDVTSASKKKKRTHPT